jgi:hypothetical protein
VLNLSGSNITKLSSAQALDMNGIHSLDYSDSQFLRKVPILENISTLNLRGCRNLWNLTSFRNVSSLNLSNCENLDYEEIIHCLLLSENIRDLTMDLSYGGPISFSNFIV